MALELRHKVVQIKATSFNLFWKSKQCLLRVNHRRGLIFLRCVSNLHIWDLKIILRYTICVSDILLFHLKVKISDLKIHRTIFWYLVCV